MCVWLFENSNFFLPKFYEKDEEWDKCILPRKSENWEEGEENMYSFSACFFLDEIVSY